MRWLKRLLVGYVAFAASSVAAALIVRRVVPEFGNDSDDVVSLVASMSGRRYVGRSDALRAIDAVAFMGGIEIDLSETVIVDGARLRLHAVMGGIEVTVPSTWNIDVVSRAVMGGVDNGCARTDGDAPLLVVEALAVMGGIDIRQGSDG